MKTADVLYEERIKERAFRWGVARRESMVIDGKVRRGRDNRDVPLRYLRKDSSRRMTSICP
jgi:hypothetical protein